MAWKPDYVTLALLKNYLNITDTADDVLLALWITATSGNVDDYCQRQFGQVATAEERIYDGHYDRRLCTYVYEIDDVQDVTGFAIVDADDQAVTDYDLFPRNATLRGKPYEELRVASAGPLTITGLWGWTAVPAAVPTGMLMQAGRIAARRDSPFGVAGSPQQGSEIRLLAQLDPDFRTTLKPLRREWWAA